MSRRVTLLQWLIAILQHLLDEHCKIYGICLNTVRRFRPFYNLKANRQYWHYLYRRPQLKTQNSKLL